MDGYRFVFSGIEHCLLYLKSPHLQGLSALEHCNSVRHCDQLPDLYFYRIRFFGQSHFQRFTLASKMVFLFLGSGLPVHWIFLFYGTSHPAQRYWRCGSVLFGEGVSRRKRIAMTVGVVAIFCINR